MLAAFLALVQISVVSPAFMVSSYHTVEADVNAELKRLDASIDKSRQTLTIQDIKFTTKGGAYIIYEIKDLPRS